MHLRFRVWFSVSVLLGNSYRKTDRTSLALQIASLSQDIKANPGVEYYFQKDIRCTKTLESSVFHG